MLSIFGDCTERELRAEDLLVISRDSRGILTCALRPPNSGGDTLPDIVLRQHVAAPTMPVLSDELFTPLAWILAEVASAASNLAYETVAASPEELIFRYYDHRHLT